MNNDYYDQHIARNMYERELEKFHYEFDKSMFLDMISSPATSEELKIDLTRRVGEIDKQLEIVNAVIAGLQARVRNQQAHEAIMAKLETERVTGNVPQSR